MSENAFVAAESFTDVQVLWAFGLCFRSIVLGLHVVQVWLDAVRLPEFTL